MSDQRKFLADARAAGASVRVLDKESRAAATGFGVLGHRAFWMQQIFFTVRRVVYGTTLALLGLGAVAFKLGFSFTSAMQQARVALEPVSGDIGGVTKELNYLFNFTKYTPFQFKDVTIAFRQMFLGMRTVGVSADTVNQTLKAMVDALSATGKVAPMNLNRVAIALQHMAFQGRLTGFTVNQLARDGIPIFAALHKEMGLTGDQLHNISKLGIPAQDVLTAINKYIETTPGFMNAAMRQALGTFHGLFTTFKDNVSQLFGIIEQPAFPIMMRWIRGVNSALGDMSAAANKSHGSLDPVLKVLDQHIGHGVNLARTWRILVGYEKALWAALRPLAIAFFEAWRTLRPFTTTMQVLTPLLRAVAWALNAIQPVLTVLVTLWLLERSALALLNTAIAINTGLRALSTIWTTRQARAETLYLIWLYRREYATKVMSALETAWIGIQIAAMYVTESLAGAIETLTLAMMTNPVGLLIAAFALLVVGLVVLYFKWQAFHNFVNRVATWIAGHWWILAFGPVWAPLAAGIVLAQDHLQSLIGWLQKLYSWAKRAGNALASIGHHAFGIVGGVGHFLTRPFGMASGGDVTQSGSFMVGEKGPELVHLPAGSHVTPNHALPGLASVTAAKTKLPNMLQIRIPIDLDGKQIAESVAYFHLSELASA